MQKRIGTQRGSTQKDPSTPQLKLVLSHIATDNHVVSPCCERVLVRAQLLKHGDSDSSQGASFSGPGGKGNVMSLKIFGGDFDGIGFTQG